MRPSRRILFPIAAVLGAGAVALPAALGSETTITAVNEGGGIYGEGHRWSPSSATVAENGTVTFSNPTNVEHGIEWVGGPATPTCEGSVPVGNSASSSGTQWSGSCTFTKPGTYSFYCTVHGPSMSGTITVSANGTTTVTTPSGETTPTGSSAPSTSPPPPAGGVPGPGQPSAPAPSPATVTEPASLLLGGVSKAVKLSSAQSGSTVRGSLNVGAGGAAGRLEVRLLAASSALGGSSHGAEVLVGRLVRSSLHGGRLSFVVDLRAAAARALRLRHRLDLEVRIVLEGAHGQSVTIVRHVRLRD